MFVFTDINTRLDQGRGSGYILLLFPPTPLLSSPLLSPGVLSHTLILPLQPGLSTIDTLLTFIVHFRFVLSIFGSNLNTGRGERRKTREFLMSPEWWWQDTGETVNHIKVKTPAKMIWRMDTMTNCLRRGTGLFVLLTALIILTGRSRAGEFRFLYSWQVLGS